MRALKLAALAAATLLPAGCADDGLTAIELPIARLEIVGGGSQFMIEGQTLQLQVRAWTADDQEILDPIVRWSTNNSSVVNVTDRGLVRATGGGDATVTVVSTTGSAQDDVLIRVAFANPK